MSNLHCLKARSMAQRSHSLHYIACWLLVAVLAGSADAAASASAEGAVEFSVGADAQVLSRTSDQVEEFRIVLSAAEKTGRELRIKDELVVSGTRQAVLWRLPDAAELDATFRRVAAQLSGETLFSCEGRDCGRSHSWANLVFKEPLLYGQDRFQRYRVVRNEAGVIQLVYLIQRGNRRLHLLHSTLTTAETALDRRSVLLNRLNRSGVVRLAAEPRVSGELTTEDLEALRAAGAQLAPLNVGEVYVVCHLYGEPEVASLLAASSQCATLAAEALQAGYEDGQLAGVSEEPRNRARSAATRFVAFGAGPLLPRLATEADGGSRVELVLPSRVAPQ